MTTGLEPGLPEQEDDKNAPALGGARAIAQAVEALNSEGDATRRRAAMILVEHGAGGIVETVKMALRHPDNSLATTYALAKALGTLDDAEDHLLDCFYTTPTARLGLINMLGNVAGRRTIALLIVLCGHPRGLHRAFVQEELEDIGTPAIEPLLTTLEHGVGWLPGYAEQDAERLQTLIDEISEHYLRERLRNPRWSLHFDVNWQRNAQLLQLVGMCGVGEDTAEKHRLHDVLVAYLGFSRYWEHALRGIAELRCERGYDTLRGMIEKRAGPRGSRAATLLAEFAPDTLPIIRDIAANGTPAGRENIQSALRLLDGAN